MANDTKRLESLYNNTLKKIIERMGTKDKSIPRPADKEALLVLQAKHDDIVGAIYRKEPKDKSVDEYRDEIWLPEERVKDTVAAQQLQQEISDEWDTMIAEEEEEEGGRMTLSSRPSASQRRKLREEKTQHKASARELHREVSEEWDTEIEEEPIKVQSSRASISQKKDLPEVRARRHEVREMSDIDMDMDIEESSERQPSKAIAFKKKDLPEKKVRRRELKVESDSEMEEPFERKPSKASTSQKKSKQQQQSQQRRQPAHYENDMDIDDINRPPAAVLLSQKATKTGASGSRPSAVRESRRIPVIQATKPRAKKNLETDSRERHKDVPDSDRSDFEVEKEEVEEEEEDEEPVKRKRNRKDSKEAKSKRRQRTNGSPTFSNSADEDDGNNGNDSADDSDTGKWANGRRRSRKWTLKEVQVLMELVPMFQYDESEVKARKRTIKWAALKRYDMDHGYVLRHRSQVMLKDKYREQTDQGKHRQRVRALRLARQALKKKAAKEAEEAGTKKAAKGKITRDHELSEDGNDEDVYEEDIYEEEHDNEEA